MERRVIQEFIEIYRSEPSLWKVRSSHYNNKAIKSVAYRRMVAKLREVYANADVEMVKRKINALRTNYRKELRKVEKSKELNKKTGEPVYVPSLWYFELFHFIADKETDIVDVTGEGVDMFGVDSDESIVYEREDSSDEFDEEFQVSSPESPKNAAQAFSQNPPKRHLALKSSEEHWPLKQESPSPSLDGQEAFGRYVASKLEEMDRGSRMLSERLIAEVLFRGQMGVLKRNTCLSNDDQQTCTGKVERGEGQPEINPIF